MPEIIYRDINLNFIPNPTTGDIGSFTDEESINRSIKNLVLTNVFERFFDHQKAGGVKELLFEPSTLMTKSILERRITDVIENFEPRAELLDVDVELSETRRDGVSLKVVIKYYSNVSTEPAEFKFIVERVI